jgi:hypothetical protein
MKRGGVKGYSLALTAWVQRLCISMYGNDSGARRVSVSHSRRNATGVGSLTPHCKPRTAGNRGLR